LRGTQLLSELQEANSRPGGAVFEARKLRCLFCLGYYRGQDLVYVARVRNGLVPASRRQVCEKIRHLVSPTMPFVNLPDTHKSRWAMN